MLSKPAKVIGNSPALNPALRIPRRACEVRPSRM
jgi:hypothetical protein